LTGETICQGYEGISDFLKYKPQHQRTKGVAASKRLYLLYCEELTWFVDFQNCSLQSVWSQVHHSRNRKCRRAITIISVCLMICSTPCSHFKAWLDSPFLVLFSPSHFFTIYILMDECSRTPSVQAANSRIQRTCIQTSDADDGGIWWPLRTRKKPFATQRDDGTTNRVLVTNPPFWKIVLCHLHLTYCFFTLLPALTVLGIPGKQCDRITSGDGNTRLFRASPLDWAQTAWRNAVRGTQKHWN
jgi:hypothetical protein